MGTGFPGQPALGYLRAFLGKRMSRLAGARQSKDLGASAIELAIITAVVVGLAATVLVIIYNIVNTRAGQINSNNGQIP
jgi:hypothetical protein